MPEKTVQFGEVTILVASATLRSHLNLDVISVRLLEALPATTDTSEIYARRLFAQIVAVSRVTGLPFDWVDATSDGAALAACYAAWQQLPEALAVLWLKAFEDVELPANPPDLQPPSPGAADEKKTGVRRARQRG